MALSNTALDPPSTHPDPDGDPTRIHLSSSAVERIREMLKAEELEDTGGLRISARLGAGCSAPLHFDLVLEVEPEPEDVVLRADGVRIFLDPTSAWTLDGLRVDYVDSPVLGQGFAFQHPRGAGGRAC